MVLFLHRTEIGFFYKKMIFLLHKKLVLFSCKKTMSSMHKKVFPSGCVCTLFSGAKCFVTLPGDIPASRWVHHMR